MENVPYCILAEVDKNDRPSTMDGPSLLWKEAKIGVDSPSILA
jgi:hypothetical protein